MEEKAYFVGKTSISSSKILKPLENYYKLTESEDLYDVTLVSDPGNIDEIKDILFDEDGDDNFLGELTSLEANFSFEKEHYYPLTFEWKIQFLNEDSGEVTEIRQMGLYEKVNELENIEIPEEIHELNL